MSSRTPEDQGSPEVDLSDEELDAVSGGEGLSYACVIG